MTSRTDVKVDYNTSPRVITVGAPSSEIIIQDIVDTLRDGEAAFAEGLSYDKLLNASGKDNLGGGVLVGLTGSLQNALLAFEGRTTPASTGTIDTVTVPPTPSRFSGFTDASATFRNDGVQRGSLLINFTDKSVADVHEVISQTELVTKKLINGTLNEFTIGDDYYVFNIVQVKVQGGNLVAVDEDGVALESPILPTAFTQVILTSSASATLQEQADIEYSSFGGGITVHTGSGLTGTSFPIGTPRAPVNNIFDAVLIATIRGFSTIFLQSNVTLSAGDVLAGFNLIGESQSRTIITIDAAADVTDCEYREARIEGILDGNSAIENCELGTISFVNGIIKNSVLTNNPITLGGNTDAQFIDCVSGVPGTGTPTIDMGGSGQPLAIRGYNGGLAIRNKTGIDSVSIDMSSGQLIIEDSVDAGTVVMRGIATWVNRETYAGNATVVNQLIDGNLIQALDRTVFDAQVRVNLLTGVAGTLYPTGTSKSPSNNMIDALQIASNLNIVEFYLETSVTLPDLDFSNKQFSGVSASSTMLTIPAGAIVDDVSISNVILGGDIGGRIVAERCNIIDMVEFRGWMLNVAIGGGAIIELSGSETSYIFDSWSAATGADYPIIDFGGTGNGLAMRNYSGGVRFQNKTGPQEVSVSLVGGEVTIENTVTAGTLTLRGTGTWANEDTYTGGATVLNELVDGVFIQDLSRSAYENAVHVNVNSSNAGTVYPVGTPLAPVNNIVDAAAIAAERGFTTIQLRSDITLTTGDFLANFRIIGQSESKTTITIEAGATVDDCTYTNATITGVLDGQSTISECILGALTVVSGVVRDSVIGSNTIVLGGAAGAEFINCVSGVPGIDTPTIDMGGTGQSLAIRNYSGGMRLINKTGTDSVSIDMNSGQIIIDDTVTAGVIVLRGIATWANRETYAGGANIVNQLIDGNLIQALDRTVYDRQVTYNAVAGTSGTLFPVGSPKQPVNNLTDALALAIKLNVEEFFLETSAAIPIGPDFSEKTFVGISASRTVITIPSGASVNSTTYRDAIITGTLSGPASFERCQMLGLSNFSGIMLTVGLFPTYTITLGNNADAYILDSWSAATEGGVFPIVDMGGTGQSLTMRNYAGAVELTNKTGDDVVSVSLAGGSIVLNNSVTSGTITLRGTGTWVNESEYTGGANVDNELIDGEFIQDLSRESYGEAVHVNVNSSNTGTSYPTGTTFTPVNNLPDAVAIANLLGFKVFDIISDITLTAGASLAGFTFAGQSESSTTITVEAGADVDNCTYRRATLVGVLDGESTISNCTLGTLSGVAGIVRESALGPNNITLGNNAVTQFIDCYSGIPGIATPTIDMGGVGQAMAIRNYNGGLRLINKSGTDDISIDMGSGQIVIDDTVNGGNIVMRGIATWSNRETYGGTATITNQLIDGNLIQALDRTVYAQQVVYNATTGVAGTAFPTGTHKLPTNNISDAAAIGLLLKIEDIFLETSATIPLGIDFTDITFIGISASKTVITVPAGANVLGTTFRDAIVTGTLSGAAVFERCQILNVSNFNGIMLNVGLFPTYTLTLGGGVNTYILDSWSAATEGGVFPVIDMGGSGQGLTLRNYGGAVKLVNKTGADAVSVSLAGGSIVIDNTVTAGTITLRGTGTWVNENTYTGGATIDNELVDGEFIQDLSRTIYENSVHIDVTSGFSGTAYPVGTPAQPVNNTADALAIAASRGFTRLDILSDVTFTTGQDISNFSLFSNANLGRTVTLNAGVISEDSSYSNVTITGTTNNYHSNMNHCLVLDLSDFHGDMENCGLQGTVTLGGGNHFSRFIDCYGAQYSPIATRAKLNVGINRSVSIHGFKGSLDIENMNSLGSVIFVGLVAGSVRLLNTILSGNIFITGIGGVELDESDPATNVNIAGLISNSSISNSVWDEILDDHIGIGSTGEALKNTGTNSTSTETKVDEIHKLHGLDTDNPLVVSSDERSVGTGIVQDVTDDGLGTVTVTRQ